MGEIRSCRFCGRWLLRRSTRLVCRMCGVEGCDRCISEPPVLLCIDCQEEIELQHRKEKGRVKP